MSWKDRLRPNLTLISPQGNVFEPLWSGNSRSMEKKLGIFEFPKIKGLKIQDLDVGGVSYPLTFFFEGLNHDQEANRFFKACKERGPWEVNHPVRGGLSLQLVSVSESIEPVTSGNITVIESEWLEPQEIAIVGPMPQVAAQIQAQTIIANNSAANQLDTNILQDTAGFVKRIQTETNKLTQKITAGLKTLTEPVAEINSSILAIQRSIQGVITQATVDVLALGGQIQQLIQLPSLASTDIQVRLTTYGAMIADIFTLFPSDDDLESKNTISLHEVALSAAITAVAQIVSTGTLETRSQAVETIETTSQLFSDITDALDNVQDLFQAKTIDLQYFSQSDSFADSALITALGIQYLQQALFDLAIERRITLKSPRSPIEITITEYGDLGENDSNFDLFLESNRLQGNDILLLPAGREVVVYA